MYSEEDEIPDPMAGEEGVILARLVQIPNLTAEKKRLVEELSQILKGKGYITFKGDPRNYRLSRVGEFCVYQISSKRRGALLQFAGKNVRIVCVAPDRYSQVWYLAGPVELIVADSVTSSLLP